MNSQYFVKVTDGEKFIEAARTEAKAAGFIVWEPLPLEIPVVDSSKRLDH